MTGWNKTRLDRVATVSARIGWKALTAAEYQEEGFVFLSTPNIKQSEIDFENVNYISQFRFDESPNLKLQVGDVLLVKDGNTLGITNVVSALPRQATVNGSIAVLRPFAMDGRFLRHQLDALPIQGRIQAFKDGMGVPHLFQRDINRFPLVAPPMAEQRAIADYLDAETARIDALITKKQQLIHLLEERRWRTFDELAAASTTELVPLRRVLTFLTDGPFGSAFSSSDYVDSGMAVIRLGNIGFAEFRGDELAYLPTERQPEFLRHRVREGDLLAAALGDVRNHAGRACVAPDLDPAIVKGKCFCARVDDRSADVEYVAMACSSPSAAERFRLNSQGSTRQMINLEIFKSLRIPLPSADEQRRVVADVHQVWQSLDGAIAALTNQISLLTEHRNALITSKVTGEVAVRGGS